MRLFLSGLGVVGLSLCEMLVAQAEALRARFGLTVQLVGAADSSGAVLCEGGIEPLGVVAAKRAGVRLAEAGRRPQNGDEGGLAVRGGSLLRAQATAGGLELADLAQRCGAECYVDCSPTNIRAAKAPTDRMLAMLAHRMHVVSANKGPLATAMPALLEAARYNGVALRYSGTVGGGTPVLATGEVLNLGQRVVAVRGIVNGTTNFILWKMAVEGWSFDVALAEAQRLGYAEADPSADVDGWDAAAKCVILANAVVGVRATVADVRVTGIRGVTAETIARAKAGGKVIKLIAEVAPGGLSVAPMEVDASGPLNTSASVNAVMFTLESGAEVTVTGRGAGGPETATAVLRDIVEIARGRVAQG